MIVISELISSKRNIESIDFFKGIAILMVVFVHSVQRFSVPYWFTVLPSLGQLGCQIFFVISSFSLCLGYSNKKIKYFDFLKRRISKMFIGYWSMIAFYLFVNIFFAIRDNESIVSFITNPGLFLNLLFLHGFSPDKAVVNGVVRGGWFVGTITILYMLFPLMLKLFKINNAIWNKVKVFVFPVLFYILSFSTFILYGFFNPGYDFENNSVSYFSFINQLPCFALGFSLYEIYIKNNFSKIKFSFIKFLFFSLVSLALFFINKPNTLIFMSFFVALSFFYAYISVQNNTLMLNKINLSSNKILLLIKNFGKNSFSVYLTHPIIVHLAIKPILERLNIIYNNNILWYIILCPIMFVASYFLALLFKKYEKILLKLFSLIKENFNKRYCHKN